MLRPHRDDGLGDVEDIVRAGYRHAPGDGRQYALGRDALVVVDVVRALRADHGDRARLQRQAALDVQRLPGARGLVLGDEVGILRRRAHGRHVGEPGRRATDVEERKPDGAPYRRVRVRPGAERVVPGVDAELAHYGTVDDDEGRAGMRRR